MKGEEGTFSRKSPPPPFDLPPPLTIRPQAIVKGALTIFYIGRRKVHIRLTLAAYHAFK